MSRPASLTGARRPLALLESFLASQIWASSFVLVKVALGSVGPLTLAALRYSLGFLILLPFLLGRPHPAGRPSRRLWLRLAAIGVSAYTIGNGAFFWGLQYLSATTVSFLMSTLPIMVLVAGLAWLHEKPSWLQALGVLVSFAGAALFFAIGWQAGEPIGLAVVLLGLLAFTAFGILGREVARDRRTDTLTLTALPLAIGGGLLLLIALPVEGLPSFSGRSVAIVLWLAAVNTALAYSLYNHSLQVLTALEMNVMLNVSPFGTALFAFLLLGERVSAVQLAGMAIAVTGVVLVQGFPASRAWKSTL